MADTAAEPEADVASVVLPPNELEERGATFCKRSLMMTPHMSGTYCRYKVAEKA